MISKHLRILEIIALASGLVCALSSAHAQSAPESFESAARGNSNRIVGDPNLYPRAGEPSELDRSVLAQHQVEQLRASMARRLGAGRPYHVVAPPAFSPRGFLSIESWHGLGRECAPTIPWPAGGISALLEEAACQVGINLKDSANSAYDSALTLEELGFALGIQ